MLAFNDVCIYSLENCPRCAILKTKLDNWGICYHEIIVHEGDKIASDIVAAFVEIGIKAQDVFFPVVSVDGRLMQLFQANAFFSEAVKL